jgi:diguanylate cyclase (GGDEF)-like protein/PAS domain S-box-containing protein
MVKSRRRNPLARSYWKFKSRKSRRPDLPDPGVAKRDSKTPQTRAALFDAIFRSATDAIYVKDIAGRYLLANDACESYLGIPHNMLIGQTDRELFGDAAALPVAEGDAEVAALCQTRTYEISPIHSPVAGNVFLVTKLPYRDTAGAIVGTIGIAREITSHKTNEAKLTETVSLLISTLESTADGLLAVDRHGRIAVFNQKLTEMWNVSPQLLEGQTTGGFVQHVVKVVKNPETAMARIQDLRSNPDMTIEDTFELIDGRVFQRFSQPQRLRDTTVGRIWSFRDVTERVRAEERLAFRAFHDSLTRLPNRELFFDRLESALARARRHHRPVATLFLDLDDLKAINDNLGHVAGDTLLREAAARILACVRDGDTVARLSGDEFAVVLDDAGNAETMRSVAERIIQALRKPLALAGHSVSPTASVGLAISSDEESSEALLAKADAAMYQAKALGKGGVVVFEEGMALRRIRRMHAYEDGRRDPHQGGRS